ncbi:MAG TPA: elongation factor Ts [Alphaproteobacteria bacterium]|nr:elongation factor Ts [Alphaproteobacteria bacterium]
MSEITASMVKDLREKTGAGMMDCKSALTETKGDMEAAIDWLRTKGLAKAAKKAGRVAAEGLVGVASRHGTGAVVELNSETDFVARNEIFQSTVLALAEIALDCEGHLERLKAKPYPNSEGDVAAHIAGLIGTIGENMTLRRTAVVEAHPGVVATYVHNAVQPAMGKIGVLVGLKSEGDTAKLNALGRQIAMHVAAASPVALREEEVDPALVERERAIFTEQSRASGKPDAVIQKMVEGRLRKFYEEVVLLKQAFIINPDVTVEAAVKAAEADAGAPITLVGFVRYGLGEGIQKDDGPDFAAEVAAAAKL